MQRQRRSKHLVASPRESRRHRTAKPSRTGAAANNSPAKWRRPCGDRGAAREPVLTYLRLGCLHSTAMGLDPEAQASAIPPVRPPALRQGQPASRGCCPGCTERTAEVVDMGSGYPQLLHVSEESCPAGQPTRFSKRGRRQISAPR